MPPFLHRRQWTLEELLTASDAVLRACTDRDPEVVDLARRHLGDAAKAYGELGIPDAENHARGLLAQVAEAQAGVNPLTHERVATYRREMQRTVVLQLVLDASDRMRGEYADVRTALAGLRERLTPLALYALQKGFVPGTGDRSPTQAELEIVWKSLCDNPESRSATRQVAMGALPADVLLLLGELLDAVRS